MRGVEGPRRCLLADALRSFPAANCGSVAPLYMFIGTVTISFNTKCLHRLD
jgi:hypothetical protein